MRRRRRRGRGEEIDKTGRQAGRQTDGRTDGRTVRQADRQTDRQTDILISGRNAIHVITIQSLVTVPDISRSLFGDIVL